MAVTIHDEPFRFGDLPAELRIRVYQILFFGCEDEASPIQPHRALEPYIAWRNQPLSEVEDPTYNGTRHIHPNHLHHPYQKNDSPRRRSPLAVFRVNHAIQAESEPVFYGLASFNLTGTRSYGDVETGEFLSKLPRRYRRLVRRVEHLCYNAVSNTRSSPYWMTHQRHSLFGWTLFMRLLAQECPALQSLKLWIYPDEQEAEWLDGAKEADPWVQATLQLHKLQNFQRLDMPTIARDSLLGSSRMSDPCRTASILSLLQVRLVQNHRPTVSATPQQNLNTPLATAHFPILKLPRHIRARVFRFALLPDNKRVHPYVGSWYDGTTRNAIPLFSTCREIWLEAENVLYGRAMFSVPSDTLGDPWYYIYMLRTFFEKLNPRLRAKVRHVSLPIIYMRHGVSYLCEELDLDLITFHLSQQAALTVNNAWAQRGRNMFDRQRQREFTAIKRVKIEVADQSDVEVSPKCRDWLERGLREEWLKAQERRQSLRSRGRAVAQS